MYVRRPYIMHKEIIHKGPRTILMEMCSRLNWLKFRTEVVFNMLIKCLNGHEALKAVLVKLYMF